MPQIRSTIWIFILLITLSSYLIILRTLFFTLSPNLIKLNSYKYSDKLKFKWIWKW